MSSLHHVTPDSNAATDTARKPAEGFDPATMPILARHLPSLVAKYLAVAATDPSARAA